MSNSSKSLALPFIIFAGVIFAGAAAWKFLGNSDDASAPVKSAPVETVSTPEPKPVKQVKADPVETPRPVEPTPVKVLSEEEIIHNKKRAKNFMQFAMRYKTPENALDGLRLAVEENKTERAEFIIDFINQHFPNTEIPSELLEF